VDELINVTIADKVAHAQHLEWLKTRRKPDPERIAEARRLLRSAGSEPPEPGDELPKGFVWPEIK